MCPVIKSIIQYILKTCAIANGIYTNYTIHNLIIATLKVNLITTAIGSFLKAHVTMWISDNTFNVKSVIAMIVV